MIFHLVRNDADAWDLAQDAFVRAWRAIDKFEARSSFYTWIFRIAHNGAYDFLRKKRPTGEEELGDLNQGRCRRPPKRCPRRTPPRMTRCPMPSWASASPPPLPSCPRNTAAPSCSRRCRD
ncbi:MAG: sigma-70 family RNA polymerase sigma factor [Verrucomicrobiales bacterium]